MTADTFMAALTTEENLGARYILAELFLCSDEHGGCEGCAVRRACTSWWDRIGCDVDASSWRTARVEWRRFIDAQRCLRLHLGISQPAPTRSPRSMAAARST